MWSCYRPTSKNTVFGRRISISVRAQGKYQWAIRNSATCGISYVPLFWLCGLQLTYVGHAKKTIVRLTKAPICPKQRKWMWSENKKNISVWPQENEDITKCHARKRKCASKHILKKPILRSDRDLAHTKEQYNTHTTTHSSCTTPQTSQDQSVLKRQENVHFLVYAVKQFLAKSIFLLTKTFWQGKEQIAQSPTFITFSSTMD